MKRALFLLAFAGSALAAGSVQQSFSAIGGSGNYALTFYWTGDASSGSIPITPAIIPSPYSVQGLRILQVETVPRSPAPTSGYNVALTDASGGDLMTGACTNLSSTVVQFFSATAGTPPVVGTFNLSISNQLVGAAQGTVIVYIGPSTLVSTTVGTQGPQGPAGPAGPPGGAAINTGYNFAAQSPGGSLVNGVNAITMTPVPPGVNGTDLYHYLYVSGGTGTPEACLIVGGSGTAGQTSGQILIQCGNSHTGAWTIRSANSGIQEAIIANPGSQINVAAGVWPIYGTLSLGNGDANQTTFTTQSTYQGFRVLGGGAARDFVTPYGTKLQWQGASGGTMVIYRGPVSQVELGNLAIDGNNLAGDIVVSRYGDQGFIHDLLLGNSKTGTYFGFRCDYGCGSNVFLNVHIVQQQSGTSDMAMGYQPVSQGVSQNKLAHVYGQFPADTSTSFGLVLQAADNNVIDGCDFQGAILTVAGATNANPIVITSSNPIPGIATGQKVTILGVTGNTAANNTVSNPQWTITAIDTTHFSLQGSTGNGAFAGGGSINGPGYALSLITNGNEPIENVFIGGAFFNALSFDDDAGHGTNQLLGVSTADGFLMPPSTSEAGLINPDYYVMPDTGGGWSRLIGRLKLVDTTQILGYMKLYPSTRNVAIGDALESLTNPGADLLVTRTGANAVLSVTASGGLPIVSLNGAHITSGTGSPNGSVTGNPGDLYLNKSGGAGTSIYVKESGSGTNTGWIGK